MLHRANLGSFERFIGILIEHYADKLPRWLAPGQIVVATITGDADSYAREVHDALDAAGFRPELDLRHEKFGFKVREHSLAKVPVSSWWSADARPNSGLSRSAGSARTRGR